jgi:hypothetical protein
MSNQWRYQLRIYLRDELAEIARGDPANPALGPLPTILAMHNATMKCQFDAFADYIAEAERQGIGGYPLYEWTKATIEDPVKKAKYTNSFSLYIGGAEVYTKEQADALDSDLHPLLSANLITRMSKHDTNPANNPQVPAQYRKHP